jgi:hypothetical protein
MSFDLKSIGSSKQNRPPRIVTYGPEGIGKSTFGASAPSPIFLPTEDGLDALDVQSFPLATSYSDVKSAIGALQKDKHSFSTLVIDSVDWLEPLVWGEVCKQHDKKQIEDFGYGKGYTYAADQWRSLLSDLNDLRISKSMAIVMIGHSMIKRFDDPSTEPYDRYRVKLHEKSGAVVREWADVLGFASQRVMTQKANVGFDKKVSRGVATGERMLWLHEQPAFEAKCRYATPDSVPLSWDALMAAIVQ